MKEWRDEGVVLAARPHGEHAAIVDIFTRAQGRISSVVRGGMGQRLAPVVQPGSQVAAQWRARREEDLGTMVLEPIRSRAFVLSDRLALAGLSATCAMLIAHLPERAPHPELWAVSIPLLDALGQEEWPSLYLDWEMRLLEEAGFGLDLGSCAVTGQSEDLCYISPKTGRAVSRAGAGEWADRLFPMPAGMGQGRVMALPDVLSGLAITGHFLAREYGALHEGKNLPEARARLLALFARRLPSPIAHG